MPGQAFPNHFKKTLRPGLARNVASNFCTQHYDYPLLCCVLFCYATLFSGAAGVNRWTCPGPPTRAPVVPGTSAFCLRFTRKKTTDAAPNRNHIPLPPGVNRTTTAGSGYGRLLSPTVAQKKWMHVRKDQNRHASSTGASHLLATGSGCRCNWSPLSG